MWSGFRRSGQPLKGLEPVGLETRRLHDVANNAGSNFKTIADASFAAEQYGLAVKKGNADLLAKLNKGLVSTRAWLRSSPTAATTAIMRSISALQRLQSLPDNREQSKRAPFASAYGALCLYKCEARR